VSWLCAEEILVLRALFNGTSKMCSVVFCVLVWCGRDFILFFYFFIFHFGPNNFDFSVRKYWLSEVRGVLCPVRQKEKSRL